MEGKGREENEKKGREREESCCLTFVLTV